MDVGKVGGAAGSAGIALASRAPAVRAVAAAAKVAVPVNRHSQLLARVANVPRNNPAQVRVAAGTLPNQVLEAVKTSNGPVALELKQLAQDLGQAIRSGLVPAAVAAAPAVHAAPVGAATSPGAPQIASPSELALVPTEDAVAKAIDMIDRALQSGTATQLAAALASTG